MYKVFINDKPFFLSKNAASSQTDKWSLKEPCRTKDCLLSQVERLENNQDIEQLTVYHEDVEKLWKNFTSLFHIIETAGGEVKNSKQEILFIFRFGKWDLPKGKIEKNESIEQAALREVHEECGINDLTIIKKLPLTFHTYLQNNERILKKSYWFEMFCDNYPDLKPQLEEGITDLKWIHPLHIKEVMDNTYGTIKDVIQFTFQY